MMMDNLLAQGKARPMVVVMPLGHAAERTMDWSDYARINTSRFQDDLFADVMPLIESTYRVSSDRKGRAIAGLSMGGGQTEAIGLSHLDIFSAVGILSASMRGFDARHAALLADAEATNEQLDLLFLGCGTLDPLAAEGMADAHRVLAAAGIEHIYWTLEGGAHTWVVWRRALYEAFLPGLFRA
jgi:enterochelin esterase family protein